MKGSQEVWAVRAASCGGKKPFQHRKYNRCRATAITECYTENKFITAAINGAEHVYRENKERRLQ